MWVVSADGLRAPKVRRHDGKIVVAGYASSSNFSPFFFGLARYQPNGSLDTTFGEAGKVIIGFDAVATGVALQPNGKIVVAGYMGSSSQFKDFALTRYHPNGTQDMSFGVNGWVTTDFGGTDDHGFAVVLQPEGKIVVVGQAENLDPFDSDFALARYLPDGSLDATFGEAGKVITDLGGYDVVSAVALQPDGRVVVAGITDDFNSNDSDFALARYLPDGSLDTTFGEAGKVITDLEAQQIAAALVMQPHDGRLIVTGASQSIDGLSFDIFLARYHAILCDGVVVTQVGTARDDTIMGTSGPDVIHGFRGNDLIVGLGGHDMLCGGNGNDTLRGSSGDDLLIGGPGKDSCNGGTGSADQAEACEQMTDIP